MKRRGFGEYIRFMDKAGNYIPGRAFQNYFMNKARTYESVSYAFAPFGVLGTTAKRGGGVTSGGLVTIPNELTVSFFSEATLSGWLVEVKTVLMLLVEGSPPVESSTIMTQVWACTAGETDDEKVTISLNSPLDAVTQHVPKGILSSYRVGNLPATGNIVVA